MINHWMLRTYGEHYDPRQAPIKVGMEEPWLVRPADRKLMKDGDPALLYLMNTKTAGGSKWKVIFAVGEIRTGSPPAANGGHPTPSDAVRKCAPRGVSKAETVTVRYTSILERPVSFKDIDSAFTGADPLPHLLKNARSLSVAIEAQDWQVLEALTRQAVGP